MATPSYPRDSGTPSPAENVRDLTLEDLVWARKVYQDQVPTGDLFYRAASVLAGLALTSDGSSRLADALGVLLRTWNADYYRFHAFSRQHLADIDELVSKWRDKLVGFRSRSLGTFDVADEEAMKELFPEFEKVLGQVGAAKALHLLAPRFFPPWDRGIASYYRIYLQGRGTNADLYASFMRRVRQQCADLGGELAIGENPLKTIDEFNYCLTQGLLHESQSAPQCPLFRTRN